MAIWDKVFGKITGKKPEPAPQPVAVPTQPPAPEVKPIPVEEAKELAKDLGGGKRTGDKGIALIKSFEGLELKAYPDPATGGAPWTIGYGHTGPEVKPGLVITKEQAEDLLRKDLRKFEEGVTKLLRVEVTQNQFDALVSFAYNCGLGNLGSSTLLRKVNISEFQMAGAEFLRWNKAAGKVMAGLTKRREAEKALFLS